MNLHLLQLLQDLMTAMKAINNIIVSRGDWFGNPANIKVENIGAIGCGGSSLTVHNPLFSVHKL